MKQPSEKITYSGTRTDWETIRKFFGTFSNGVRIIAEIIRTSPEELRNLIEKGI